MPTLDNKEKAQIQKTLGKMASVHNLALTHAAARRIVPAVHQQLANITHPPAIACCQPLYTTLAKLYLCGTNES